MHARIRAAGIVIKDNCVLLIERKRDGAHYWVFPGGGVEEGETKEEAVVREVFEETSMIVTLDKLMYEYHHDVLHGGSPYQYFYLCGYVSGVPALHADSIEQSKMDQGHGFYKPQWVPLDSIAELELYPYEVRDKIISDTSLFHS